MTPRAIEAFAAGVSPGRQTCLAAGIRVGMDRIGPERPTRVGSWTAGTGTNPVEKVSYQAVLVVPRGAGLPNLAPVADLVLAIGADSRIVDAAWREHPRVRFRDKGPTVLTFRHLYLQV